MSEGKAIIVTMLCLLGMMVGALMICFERGGSWQNEVGKAFVGFSVAFLIGTVRNLARSNRISPHEGLNHE